jgi:hypothetical protein
MYDIEMYGCFCFVFQGFVEFEYPTHICHPGSFKDWCKIITSMYLVRIDFNMGDLALSNALNHVHFFFVELLIPPLHQYTYHKS